MKDRNVQHASRFRLTKVPGTDDVYDLIPAPGEVYEEGTLINKSALLKDATAALFGLGTDAVPDDALNKLSDLYKHCWKRSDLIAVTTLKGLETNVQVSTSSAERTITYGTGIEYDFEADCFVISNPQTITIGTSSSAVNTFKSLVPCYITNLYMDPTGFYYLPENSTFYTGENNDYTVYFNNGVWLGPAYATNATPSQATGKLSTVYRDFVTSTDRNAYPDSAIIEKLKYEYVGIPFDNVVDMAKIATGRYAGTGTYGSGNPNSLTFDFEPKFVIVQSEFQAGMLFWVSGMSGTVYRILRSSSTEYVGKITFSENTLTWYGTNAENQMNYSNYVYHYIAIG